jgi:predicted RecB family nuclease
LAGFSWHSEDAGGANSLLKYKEAVSVVEPVASKAQDWLRKYNIDDVMATMALRNWLRDQRFD